MLSCKSNRQIVQTPRSALGSVEQTIEQIKQAQIQFKTLNISKLTLSANLGQKQQSVSASCKIVADSALQISVQPMLGIEIFRIEMTADSIFLFDKFNGNYAASDFAELSKMLAIKIDFATIQALLTNQYFIYDCKNECENYCKIENNSLVYSNNDIEQSMEINTQNRISRTKLLQIQKQNNLTVEYQNAATPDYNANLFPEKITLTANLRNTRNAVIEFAINKVTIDSNFSMQRLDRSRYQKIDISNILPK